MTLATKKTINSKSEFKHVWFGIDNEAFKAYMYKQLGEDYNGETREKTREPDRERRAAG